MSKPFAPLRRTLLKALGAGLPATAATGALVRDTVAATEPAASVCSAPAGSGVSHFFNERERITVDAIVARLIPNDELGPGAKEACVTEYLDRQLAGAWGSGDNFYRHGPFQGGTPEQGYQLALTPAESFREGLSRMDAASAREHGGRSFTQLTPAQQDAMLTAMQKGEVDMGPLPAKVFFQLLLDSTMEGFFSDPIHGGNRDMIGWKLLGFPGVYASYTNDIERHNVAYVRPPMSIAMARAAGHRHGGEAHGAPAAPANTAPAAPASAAGVRR